MIKTFSLAGAVALSLVTTMAVAQDGRFAASFGGPSAMASPDGLATIAATYADPRGGIKGNDADGEIGVTYSFGSAVRNVSVTVGASITGTTKPFGDAGSFTLNASRLVHVSEKSLTFVGASASGLGSWGPNAASRADRKAQVAVTNTGVIGAGEIPYIASIGYGQDVVWDSKTTTATTGQLKDGASYAFGLGVIPNVSLGISGTETQTNAGVVVGLPFAPGVSIAAGVYDVGGRVHREQKSITIGYGIDTKGLFK